MRAVMRVAAAVGMAALLVAAPAWAKKKSKKHAAEDTPAPAAVTGSSTAPTARPGSFMVDAFLGASAVPAAIDPRRSIWDRLGGIRVGYTHGLLKGWLRVGGEASARSTLFAMAGNQPIWQVALAQRLAGHSPHQVIRWQQQVTGAGTVGLHLERFGAFVEPTLQAGLGASWRQVAVHLDRAVPYNRSTLTLGPLVGVSLLAGIGLLYWRWDAIGSAEVGPPPFTARYPTFMFNMSLGLRI